MAGGKKAAVVGRQNIQDNFAEMSNIVKDTQARGVSTDLTGRHSVVAELWKATER